MTKKELFDKYRIEERHNNWNSQIDSWYSVEIYKLIKGKMPENDESLLFVLDFLDKTNDMVFVKDLMENHPNNWGVFHLAAKRIVHRYSDLILKELNKL